MDADQDNSDLLRLWQELNSLYKLVQVVNILRPLLRSFSLGQLRVAVHSLPFTLSLTFFPDGRTRGIQEFVELVVEKGSETIEALKNGRAVNIERQEGYLHPWMESTYHGIMAHLKAFQKAKSANSMEVKPNSFPVAFEESLKDGSKTFEFEADFDLQTNEKKPTKYQLRVLWERKNPSSGSRPTLYRDIEIYIADNPLPSNDPSTSSNQAQPRPTHRTSNLPPSFHLASVDSSLIDASPYSEKSVAKLDLYNLFLGQPNGFTFVQDQDLADMPGPKKKEAEQFLSSFFIKHEDGTQALALSALLGAKMIFFGETAKDKMWERISEPEARGGNVLGGDGESSTKKRGVLGLHDAVRLKPFYQKLGIEGLKDFDESVCDAYKTHPTIKKVLEGLDDDFIHLWDPDGSFGNDIPALVAEFQRVSTIFEGQGCGRWFDPLNTCRYCYAEDEWYPTRKDKEYGPGKLGAFSTYEEDVYKVVDEGGNTGYRQVMYCPDDAKLQQFCKDMGFSFVDFLALQARVQYHPRQLFGTFSPCFSCFFPVLGNSSVVGDPKCVYHFMCTNCKAFHEVLSPEEEAIKNRNVVEITSNAGVSRPELESVLSAEPANLQFIPCGVNSEVCQKFAEIQKNTVVTTRINGAPSCLPCFAFGKVASSLPPWTMLEKAVIRLIDDQVAIDAGEEVEFPALSDFISDVSLSVEGKWYDPAEVYRYLQDYLQMSPAQRALKSVGFQDLLKKLKK